jgi:hypothetical protein
LKPHLYYHDVPQKDIARGRKPAAPALSVGFQASFKIAASSKKLQTGPARKESIKSEV